MGRRWIALCNLICNFWKVDRIRISPNEGLLLRLSNKTIVVIKQQPLQIKKRNIIESGEQIHVEYICEGKDGLSRLNVTQNDSSPQLQVEWETRKGVFTCLADQIDVYPM